MTPRSRPGGDEVLCGPHAVLEQLRADPSRLRRVLATEGRGALAEAKAEVRRRGISVETVDARTLDRLAGGHRHQGIVAEVEPFPYVEEEDLFAEKGLIVALDEVTDPRNVGAVIRTVEAAGAAGVLMPRHRSAGVTAAVVRASAGATARVPVARVTNLVRTLETAKKADYWIIGLDGEAERTLFETDVPDPCVLVFGAEGRGLRPMVRRTCDLLASLPMRGAVASLNVSVAAGIALYELLRRHSATAG